MSIRLAVACAQTGSLTAAARESHLALAAASRRIRELEDALGSSRCSSGMRAACFPPLPAGVFVKHGLALLQTMEQLGGELADLRQGIARHVRLCASTAAINQFLPPLLARYAKSHPQVRVDLDEQVFGSSRCSRLARRSRADVAVFVEGPDTHRP